jgi:hypothetical protein
MKVHHRYPTPAAKFATSFTSVVDIGGKFATGVNDTGGGNNDTDGDRWQTMETITDCRYLKVTLKAKFIYMLTVLSKGVPTKLLKFF